MVRKLAFLLFSILVGAGPFGFGQSTSRVAVSGTPGAAIVSNKLIGGRVVAVTEGDALTLKRADGGLQSIRFQGVDAPDEKQNYHKKSRKNLSELLLNKDVTVVLHKRDTTGEYLATVFMEGRDIGLLQIEMGLAWHFRRYGYEQTAGSHKLYADAEARAKAAGMGLWEDKHPQAPWTFRGEELPAQLTTLKSAEKGQAPALSSDDVGKKYQLGPRGGCYYVSDSGRKVYVKDKSLCVSPFTVAKP